MKNMKPQEFLTLAKRLCGESNNEAALRTSVGRSYYAFHHHLYQFIISQGFFFPKDKDRHIWVFEDLHGCGIKEICEVAKALDELREERNKADYELELDTFRESNCATLLFLKAKEAWQEFDGYANSNKKRRKVAKGIHKFRKEVAQRPTSFR